MLPQCRIFDNSARTIVTDRPVQAQIVLNVTEQCCSHLSRNRFMLTLKEDRITTNQLIKNRS